MPAPPAGGALIRSSCDQSSPFELECGGFDRILSNLLGKPLRQLLHTDLEIDLWRVAELCAALVQVGKTVADISRPVLSCHVWRQMRSAPEARKNAFHREDRPTFPP